MNWIQLNKELAYIMSEMNNCYTDEGYDYWFNRELEVRAEIKALEEADNV